MNCNSVMAVVLRSEHKKILRNQLILLKWLNSLVVKSLEVEQLFREGIDRDQIDECYKDIYLEVMEDENVDKNGKFATQQEEYRFQYRRFFIKDYLRQLFYLHRKKAKSFK